MPDLVSTEPIGQLQRKGEAPQPIREGIKVPLWGVHCHGRLTPLEGNAMCLSS